MLARPGANKPGSMSVSLCADLYGGIKWQRHGGGHDLGHQVWAAARRLQHLAGLPGVHGLVPWGATGGCASVRGISCTGSNEARTQQLQRRWPQQQHQRSPRAAPHHSRLAQHVLSGLQRCQRQRFVHHGPGANANCINARVADDVAPIITDLCRSGVGGGGSGQWTRVGSVGSVVPKRGFPLTQSPPHNRLIFSLGIPNCSATARLEPSVRLATATTCSQPSCGRRLSGNCSSGAWWAMAAAVPGRKHEQHCNWACLHAFYGLEARNVPQSCVRPCSNHACIREVSDTAAAEGQRQPGRAVSDGDWLQQRHTYSNAIIALGLTHHRYRLVAHGATRDFFFVRTSDLSRDPEINCAP